ncbi:nucleotide-binding protein [Geomesophilobacter sediminis]|uniref:Tyrosine protein kinase n=1 Tax=Geomesophilobacter sediminis TaxID=2798584 RepID=A0A8J7JE73_9BACT|nr:tyrosine protein kinase [Geomesophilobacter sediminis]MBJ6724239.1 tyrosine protein kinase [Geomesophilobacter sediminis]
MAISKSSLKKTKDPSEPQGPELTDAETTAAGPDPDGTQREEGTGFKVFRGTLGKGRQKKEVAEAAAEPVEAEVILPAPRRPSDVAKMGYVSPVYHLSRTVKLNPRLLAGNRVVAFLPDSPEVEFYRQLRTRILQQTAGERGATVMITSPLPGEGKTLTSINLALTFAKEFKQTALLVDCDLRKQQIHETLGFASDRGLVDYLLDDCPVPELFVWPGVEKLTVISGGKKVNDSCELLGSPGMADLVADMRSRYPERYVFFDTPSVLSGADALAFAPLVDYILVVVQRGKTSLADLNRALELLPGEKILGVVMNRY